MKKLHLIGNSHIDPAWLWRWQEGFSEVFATWRSALDRMNDFPELKFTSACAVYYQWVEKTDPEMFKEIQQRVKEGRWNIVGGWFLQPDCNIPSGESFARHGLISQRYFKEKFGVTAKTGYNVDSFGHNADLPQILRQSGMENYVFMRPGAHECDLRKSLFKWESPDGSRVCAFRISYSYAMQFNHLDSMIKLRDRVIDEDRDLMAFFGIGNHGGGPTIKLINEINKLDIPNKVYSTPDQYFECIDKEKLPVIANELQHHARGCYSACTMVKTSNRKCEQNLLAAEKFCTMANKLIGAKYPKKELEHAWKTLLFNQFHDILGGCSIKKVYDDAGYQFGEIMSITEQEINFALQGIARKIDTLQGETLPSYKRPQSWRTWEHEVLGTPIVIFNPHTWAVEQQIQLSSLAAKITDDNGNEIPLQTVRGEHTNNNDKYNIAFIAKVPPLGYTVYRAFTEKPSETTFDSEFICENTALENSCIRVEFDKITGDIYKFINKRTGETIINQTCKAVVLDETDADTWSHGLVSLGDAVGQFDTPTFSIIENGNVRATMRITTRYNNSVLQRDYTITPESATVQVKTKVDFRETHKVLKFTFPAMGEKVTSKTAYNAIDRAKELGEEPCGSWIASGKLCVANDSKYGYDTTADEMRLTVLRSAIWADHFGVRDEFCEYMDIGIHEFAYNIFPYENAASAERKAQELNFPLRTIVDSFHNGSLPERMSCYKCDNENIVVTAIKQAEDNCEPIIRFCEMNGTNGKATINLFDGNIECNILYNRIKTFSSKGKELNMIEWEKSSET